ncbi:MAG: hypothetical protein U0Q03_08120 [Acidimicrobiales bacterium]
MFAVIWHFWIGLILTFAAILTVVTVVGGYLKQVTSQRYPGRRNRRDD